MKRGDQLIVPGLPAGVRFALASGEEAMRLRCQPAAEGLIQNETESFVTAVFEPDPDYRDPHRPAEREGLLLLPPSLTAISDDAFANGLFEEVYCGPWLRSIGHGAFAGCNRLRRIRIPEGTAEIAEDAFDGCPSGLVVIGTAGSEAERFANHRGFVFEPEAPAQDSQ